MLDLGWTELLIIGVVALIVIGPKDLPMLFRNLGRFVGKARAMARDFTRAMNEAADDSGVNEVAKGLRVASNPIGGVMDGVKDATKDISQAFGAEKFDRDSETGKLSAERELQAKKIMATSARQAAERKQAEAEAASKKAAEYEAELATETSESQT